MTTFPGQVHTLCLDQPEAGSYSFCILCSISHFFPFPSFLDVICAISHFYPPTSTETLDDLPSSRLFTDCVPQKTKTTATLLIFREKRYFPAHRMFLIEIDRKSEIAYTQSKQQGGRIDE